MLDRSADETGGAERRNALLWRAALFLAVLISFAPLYKADFTIWDDRYNIVENPRLNPPTWAGVAYYWTHTAYDLYIPVTYAGWAGLAWLGYVPDADVMGTHLNPYVFHGANVLLHAGSVLLVFEILRRLFKRNLAAGCAAMIFALHPVQVESVGWVAGFKDVLAGFLSLSALLIYLSDDSFNIGSSMLNVRCSDSPKQKTSNIQHPTSNIERRGSAIRFSAATVLLILAMLSKPIAMVVPAIALVIDLILQRRSSRQALLRFAIWLPLSIACAILSARVQPAKFDFVQVPIFQRPLIAADTLAFYLYKLVWPAHLGLDYGRSPRQTLESGWPYFTWIVPVSIAILLCIKRRAWPTIAAGAAVFVLALAPLLGFVSFDFQLYSTTADHYLYLPMLGVAIVLAAISPRPQQRLYLIAWFAIGATLAVLTWRQSQVWQDSITMFSHAVEVNPKSWVSHNNLGQALVREGQYESAERECRVTLEQHPGFMLAYADLGDCLRALHKPDEALAAYHEALHFANPNDPTAWSALAYLLSAANKSDDAAIAYRHVIQLDSTDASARTNLAAILAEQGNLTEAIDLYEASLRIQPGAPEALAGLERAQKELQSRAATQPDQH